jgi:hypothetical protein
VRYKECIGGYMNNTNNTAGITYTVPDLDAKIQIFFKRKETGESVACVEAELSNGKTVNQKGVAWTVAVISGLALVASAVTSGLGHSNTAAHVAANAMALFGYFQGQAFIGMTSVSLPPIVSAWTQNFQWSMGIIRIGFIQDIATWYQRATGGTPSTILSSRGTQSVQVQKRALDGASAAMAYAVESFRKRSLMPRTNAAGSSYVDSSNTIVVKGIDRVGYRAGIEETNIFMTGYIFFLVFVFFVVLGVLIFKGICEALTKAGRMKGDKFKDFRNGWNTVLKGIMFRVILIGFPQMVVLCFWQFTQRDSPAIVALAVFTVFTMIGILAWASAKVIRLARRSISMHKSPAYILYSDPVSLNKWGFLYVQFKATAYFFIVPVLIYFLVKGMFVGLGQEAGVVQAIGLLIIEALFLIGVCVMRPYMDKKMNAFNISIAVINLLNTIFLLIFTEVFNQPVSLYHVCMTSKHKLTYIPRASSPESWALSSSSTTPFSLWSLSSSSWSHRLSQFARRIPILVTSQCVTIVAASSSRNHSSTPSSMPWAPPPAERARAASVSRTTMTPGRVAAATVFLSNSNKPPMLQHTHSEHHTWTRPDHHSTRLPLATMLTDATRHPHSPASNLPALTTSLFVNKEPAPVRGNAVPDTTREFHEISPTDDLVSRLPPAPPPYSSVPASLQVGHPAALRPGAPEVKQVSNDELDRVVSMYYDRRSSDPVADKNWL